MASREVVTGFCSPWRVDDGDNDCVSVTIYGPGGGTRFGGILRPNQARELRDQLDLALVRINDHNARQSEGRPDIVDQGRTGSVDHMPDHNADSVDEDGCPTWST